MTVSPTARCCMGLIRAAYIPLIVWMLPARFWWTIMLFEIAILAYEFMCICVDPLYHE